MQSSSPFLEIEQRQLTAFNLPPKVVDVTLAPRRLSTKSAYARRWYKLVGWCTTWQIDPLQVKLSNLLLLLCFVAFEALALCTVKGYLLVLLTFLQ